ncbi:hypothetical protein Sango_2651300 [Sesamum angolense]|uniref:Early response to dehydration 15-like protein n=1 Tax=Sesamum angolense TaxID=2727404 RepID=A0AAE1W225_9LAMI|nr:hypothetical protein Sango_2651300 [Sesamum angolense]
MATSALNPNAPIFVPSAYLAVEDFSDEWWDLVQSSPWFRDYWLRECFSDFTGDDVDTDKAITDAVAKGKRNDSRCESPSRLTGGFEAYNIVMVQGKRRIWIWWRWGEGGSRAEGRRCRGTAKRRRRL